MYGTKFLLAEGKDGFTILRAAGNGTEELNIPEEAVGGRVTEVASYAFSDRIGERDRTERLEKGFWVDEKGGRTEPPDETFEEIQGGRLQKISLPQSLKRVGSYAFYNCRILEKISFFDSLTDLGAGAFTGCHQIKRLQVTCLQGEGSLLRDLLMELPEELAVDWSWKEERARLFFPEFFEEGVENTPARILENHVHGSGLSYRNCFYKRSLNFKEYDSLFPKAVAWEREELLFDLASARLIQPYGMTPEAEERYREYLEGRFSALAQQFAREERYEELDLLLSKLTVPEPELLSAVEALSKEGRTRAVSLLMEYRRRHVQPISRTERKRRFEL